MDEQNVTQEFTLDEEYIVLAIPKTTLEVEIIAKVWHDEEVIKVSKTLPFEEVLAAFMEADQGYIPENAVFSLTDKGLREMEELKMKHLDAIEDLGW